MYIYQTDYHKAASALEELVKQHPQNATFTRVRYLLTLLHLIKTLGTGPALL
jgi:outer membrane protein assembly factor BamD (BamD/ComL family)